MTEEPQCQDLQGHPVHSPTEFQNAVGSAKNGQRLVQQWRKDYSGQRLIMTTKLYIFSKHYFLPVAHDSTLLESCLGSSQEVI